MESLKLLQHLQVNSPESGEDLGKAFGVSRAAINKRMKLLHDYVQSSRVDGYSVKPGISVISPESIELLRSHFPAYVFSHLLDVGSTNEILMEQHRKGGSCDEVLFSEHQRSGKGRRGRIWEQPPGSGVQFSIRKSFDLDFSALSGLSLAVGLFIARALGKLDYDVELKWPNDIYLNGKKLGGVLVEVDGDINGPVTVVIGVGINVTDIPDIDVPIACLGSADKDELIVALAQSIISGLELYQNEGFESLSGEWTKYALWLGAAVYTTGLSDNVQGVFSGITSRGELVVQTDSGERLLNGGEISLRASK